MLYMGKEKTRSCFFPTPIYNVGVEKKTRSCFFPTPIYNVGVEKKQDLAFSLPLYIM